MILQYHVPAEKAANFTVETAFTLRNPCPITAGTASWLGKNPQFSQSTNEILSVYLGQILARKTRKRVGFIDHPVWNSNFLLPWKWCTNEHRLVIWRVSSVARQQAKTTFGFKISIHLIEHHKLGFITNIYWRQLQTFREIVRGIDLASNLPTVSKSSSFTDEIWCPHFLQSLRCILQGRLFKL